VHTDFSGRRIVAFPDIGCQTAPGDPNALEGNATGRPAEQSAAV